MAEFFNNTAYNRLPAEVKRLSRDTQTVCIFLRLRKTEEQIALKTGFPSARVSELANEVKRALIVGGKYDLLADPVIVSLDGLEGVGREPASDQISPEESLMLKKFISALDEAVSGLARNEKRILHLFFQRRMTGRGMLDFFRKAGSKNEKLPKSEPEVFYMIEKAIKKLLMKMEESTPIGRGTLTVKGLKEILFETGVAA